MSTSDSTSDGPGTYPRGQMSELRRRVNNALADAGSSPEHDRVREQLERYIADPDGVGAVILLSSLEPAVGYEAAIAAVGMKPPRTGLVYCCPTMGWVTPIWRYRDH